MRRRDLLHPPQAYGTLNASAPGLSLGRDRIGPLGRRRISHPEMSINTSVDPVHTVWPMRPRTPGPAEYSADFVAQSARSVARNGNHDKHSYMVDSRADWAGQFPGWAGARTKAGSAPVSGWVGQAEAGAGPGWGQDQGRIWASFRAGLGPGPRPGPGRGGARIKAGSGPVSGLDWARTQAGSWPGSGPDRRADRGSSGSTSRSWAARSGCCTRRPSGISIARSSEMRCAICDDGLTGGRGAFAGRR
jgi:hypothetical protein